MTYWFFMENNVTFPQASALRLEILNALPKKKVLGLFLQIATELGVTRLDFFGDIICSIFYFFKVETST